MKVTNFIQIDDFYVKYIKTESITEASVEFCD